MMRNLFAALLAVVLLVALAPGVAAEEFGFGSIEARAYVPIAPDPELEIGGGFAFGLGIVPDDAFAVGGYLGGRKVFADVLYVRGQCAGGLSISLNRTEHDNGERLTGAIWREDDFEWSILFSYGVPLDIGGLF